ncbi:MAG: hypothetical protein H0U98_13180 [Alphaproteobacteria bacterium]|nr:hypothetical protein [Alphaproteobacteria bacterium]
MKDRAIRLLGYAVMLNFLSFWAISFVVGDAIQGKVTNGQFYLGNHGKYTPVSHNVFILSACHAYSALGGVMAALLITMIWKWRQNSK